jgi:peptidase E
MREKVAETARNILAMGGAFGYDNDAGRRFLKLMLRLTGKRKPRIMFVGTASGDHDYGRVWFYSQLAGLNCHPSVLKLFEPVPSDLTSLVLAQDAIFVGGGNSTALLGVWRAYEFDKALTTAWEHGVVCGGASAGGICWFEQGISASSYTDKVVALNGLGLARGSFSPHYDTDPKRRPAFHALVDSGVAIDGYGVDETAAVHIQGRDNVRVLSGDGKSTCYRISRETDKAIETKLIASTLRR